MPKADKVALVTGAAKRVGRAIALALAEERYHLVIHYGRSQKEAEETVSEIKHKGVDAIALPANLARAGEIKKLLEKTLAYYGRLDVLVNNAATFRPSRFDELAGNLKLLEAEFYSSLDVNLKGPYVLSVLAGQEMHKRGMAGHIINIGDWAQISERPYKGYLPYHLSKAGLVALTQTLAQELAPLIRVNMVANGPVEPPPEYGKMERQEVIDLTPLRKWGGAHSVAEVVVGLLKFSFVTGEIIRNDGGRHLYPS